MERARPILPHQAVALGGLSRIGTLNFINQPKIVLDRMIGMVSISGFVKRFEESAWPTILRRCSGRSNG